MYELPDVTEIVALALGEDLGVDSSLFKGSGDPAGLELLAQDVTSYSVTGLEVRFTGAVVAREACVVAGLPVVAAVYEALSSAAGLFEPVETFPLVAEGSCVAAGTDVMEIDGLAVAVLAGERTALNFLMVLSGIATRARAWAEAAGPDLAVVDTRKTAPGLRMLSKYAVRVGGGQNHRTGLFDMVLIKDNHLRRSSVGEAVSRARRAHPGLAIEVEADTPAQAVEAVEAGAQFVLLDNMDDDTIASVVTRCRERARELGRTVTFEVSGGIGFERLGRLASIGVERVSSSALTLAPPVDFGLDER